MAASRGHAGAHTPRIQIHISRSQSRARRAVSKCQLHASVFGLKESPRCPGSQALVGVSVVRKFGAVLCVLWQVSCRGRVSAGRYASDHLLATLYMSRERLTATQRGSLRWRGAEGGGGRGGGGGDSQRTSSRSLITSPRMPVQTTARPAISSAASSSLHLHAASSRRRRYSPHDEVHSARSHH